jgi:hypothetical protein
MAIRNLFRGLVIAAAFVAVALSCAKSPEIIPKRQMEKIYRDMFLADQWLVDSGERRRMADTTLFYEPIFEKYGYTSDDYRQSVNYYLKDPKRYAEMIGKVVEALEGEAAAIQRDLLQREKIRMRADSIAAAMKAFTPEDFTLYGDLFYVDAMTDRIDIQKNARGVYFPVPVVEDTVFHGPELIIKDTSAAPEPLAQPRHNKIPWRY